jgi:hypothetical protein
MRAFILILFFCYSITSNAQTIISAGPQFAVAGDFFTMTVVMSGQASTPHNINLESAAGTITPWSSYNSTGNTYIVSYLLKDYEKVGFYYVTYGASTYPVPVRIDRPLTPEKFEYQTVTALNINVGTGTLDGISSMKTDAAGNLYCTGTFSGTFSMNGQSVTASGARDGFIAKYNSAGVLKWIRKTGSSIDDIAFSNEGLNTIKIHQDSVIYVTGYFPCDTSLRFNGTTPLNYPSRNANSIDGLLMKLDSAGNFQWAAFQGSLKNDESNDVEIDQNGNAIVTGDAQSEDFSSTGINDTSFTYVYSAGAGDSIALGAYANDQYGLFVAKYSPSGQLTWAKRQSRDYFSYGCYPVRMKRCSDNSLVILAVGSGGLKWDGTACTGASCCNFHYVLLKLDSAGNKLWCLEDGNFVGTMDMGIDAADNIYVTTPTVWVGGDNETFLRKYSPAGTLLWSNFIQHNKDYSGNYVSVTDTSGNTYISHSYQNQWAANPKTIVTKKYDSSGQLIAVTYPEPGTPYIENKPTAIALNAAQDKVFLAGHFRGSQRFGNTTLTNASRKPFLLSMTNCPVSYDSLSVTSCGPYLTPGGNLLTYSGYYGDTLVNAAGCDSILLITLDLYSIPVVAATASGPLSFCQGDSVILSATSGMAAYQWYNKSMPLAGATNDSLIVKASGTYYCLAQNAGLCPDTTNSIKVSVPCVPIGPAVDKIQEQQTDVHLMIFPNPGSGTFNIQAMEGDIIVYDAMGRVVHTQRQTEDSGVLNLGALPDGIYTVYWVNAQQMLHKRIQIIR